MSIYVASVLIIMHGAVKLPSKHMYRFAHIWVSTSYTSVGLLYVILCLPNEPTFSQFMVDTKLIHFINIQDTKAVKRSSPDQ